MPKCWKAAEHKEHHLKVGSQAWVKKEKAEPWHHAKVGSKAWVKEEMGKLEK